MNRFASRAFTLLEIMVALGIGSLVSLLIGQFLSQSGQQYKQTLMKAEAQKDLMMAVKFLQSDLAHLREAEPADPRFFRAERKNLFEVQAERLTFATSRGEKITYAFEAAGFGFRRMIEPLDEEEMSIRERIWQMIRERAEKSLTMVTTEVQNQVRQQIDGFKSVFDLGDLQGGGKDPAALTRKAAAIFDQLQYYTGTGGGDSAFVTDLKERVVGRARQMAEEIGYGVESDAEEIMGTLLTRYFQMEELAPPKITRATKGEKTFPIKASYRVLLEGGAEVSPAEVGSERWAKILGFRFFLESPNPLASLDEYYARNGLAIVPNALLRRLGEAHGQWNPNPPPRVRLKVMDLITRQELTGRYYGEAIIPDANILYKSWVEIPEFWFLDIFNTEEEVEKLRQGLINPDEAEPKK